MNELSFRSPGYPSQSADATRGDDYIDLDHLGVVVRRNALLMAIFVVAALGLGLTYLRFAPPVYMSEAHVLVDENIGKVADATPSFSNDMQMDTRIASEIEILKSRRLALTVVDNLGLLVDEAFLNPPPSPIGTLLSPVRGVVAALRGGEDATQGAPDAAAAVEQAREQAAQNLRQSIVVERVERSSVIAISYASHDPALAYRVTRAYADAFLQEQKLANAAASTDATAWMKVRLAQLSEQQKEAALAVEDFRRKNGLTVARGELVSEQRVSDLTAQVALAQSELARTKAQSEQLAAIIASGTQNAVKSIALSNSEIPDTVVQQLRGRYLDISRRIAQITSDFGPDHPQAVQLRREQENLGGRLFQQLQDLEARYKNDYDVARNRLNTLEGIVNQQTGQNLQSGQAVVELRKLEQDATTVNTVYTNFLSRYEEAVQRQNSPVTDLRIISNATLPQDPVGPSFTLTMLTFAVLGGFAGAAAGAFREFREHAFRTGEDVQRVLGTRFLGYLPKLFKGSAKRRQIVGSGLDGWPFELGVEPESAFAETLRNAVHALNAQDRDRGKVIGMISILPGEGKTTFSAQLARLLALSGMKTILIDADLRRPALSEALSAQGEEGIAEAVRGKPWRPLTWIDPASGLSILPTGNASSRALGSVLLSSPGMAKLMDELRQEFDYVIVDLPPIGPVIDAKAFQPCATGFILVMRWGVTSRKLASTILGEAPDIAAKIVGAVLNATDFRALSRYGARGSRERTYRAYQSYYTTRSR